MAKALYDSVNGVARKVTKKYDGVAGVSRKVTKAYDGVGGVARQYFSSDTTYSGIKSVEIISQNDYSGLMTPNPSWGVSYSYWQEPDGVLYVDCGFHHASCYGMHDYVSQYVGVRIYTASDGDGKITGFSIIDAWDDPCVQGGDEEGYFEEDYTDVVLLNEDTAFADGYLDVKMICTNGCCDATVRITFE